jgi:hypothetical protein
MGWVVNATPWQLYPREIDPIPILREAGCVPGQVWTGEEYLDSNGIRTPNRPARSDSLYRLSYFCSTYEQRSLTTKTYCCYTSTKQKTGFNPLSHPKPNPRLLACGCSVWLQGTIYMKGIRTTNTLQWPVPVAARSKA